MERLQKVIANSGYTSRRKAEELITDGHVYVNGNLVTELGTKISNNDQIVIDGVTLNLHEVKKEYYLLNKPRGYICSLDDEKDRHIVTELIDTKQRIYPVGRLDYDTTGLLILTNDGDLANILMHPSYEIVKTYLAKIEGNLSREEYFKLKEGITIDGIKCIPKKVKIKKKDTGKNIDMVEISIVEGRNHIVKKLFQAVNHEVIKLKRQRYAFLELGNLKSGEYRNITHEEVKKLYELKK